MHLLSRYGSFSLDSRHLLLLRTITLLLVHCWLNLCICNVTISNVTAKTAGISGCDVEQLSINATASQTQASSGSNCWILAQQSFSNVDEFLYRKWNDYRQGFGNASGNFWIGNQHLHRMTQLLNNGYSLMFITTGIISPPRYAGGRLLFCLRFSFF